MKYTKIAGWLLAIAMMMPLSAVPAFAQDELDEPDSAEVQEDASEDADDASFLENVASQKAPDGTEDYAEMHRMRVLERTFLPSETQANSGNSETLMPGNLMELTPESAMHVLLEGADSAEVPRGLQRQASKWMAEAVAQVKKQIENASSPLNMPFGLDCANQPAVQEYVAIFSHGASGTMKTWLKRLERWRPVLEKALNEEHVPTDLLYLAMIESGFKTRVKSPASAAGMWQFMAGTGVEMGLTINEYVDERYDPIKAAHAAAAYLKKQHARYDSWPLAMAAYNGGPGTVNVAIDRYNTNDYFKLVEYGAMYDETRRYVPRILAASLIGRNPEAFGFGGLKPEPPFVFDEVEVPGNTKLSILAEAAGCSIDTLKELNPELLKDITPPGKNYALRIPLNKHASFVEKYDNVKKKYAGSSDTITLKFGETLEILGEDIGVPARVLRNLNGIPAKTPAAYGSEILVPNGSRRGNAKSGKDKADELPIALISPEKFDFRDRTCIYYETQKGDSMREIADTFGVLPNQIAIWNELDAWAKLRPKMFLRIFVSNLPSSDSVRYRSEDELHVVERGSDEHQEIVEARRNANSKAAKSAAKSKGKSSSSPSNSKSSSRKEYVYHVVEKGDSLSKIAKKYGVSLEALLKLNGLNEKSAIKKGQKLKVKKK